MEISTFNTEDSAWLASRFAEAGEVALSVQLAQARGISAQAANARLRKMVEQRGLSARSVGRTKFYRLCPIRARTESFGRSTVEEDLVWRTIIAPQLTGFCQPQALRVLEYGATEMINNARDHSEGKQVTVGVSVDMAFSTITVSDDGEGIFARIKRLCGLLDERESLLELAKGKLTTDPDHHTGEGVFFASRALDSFTIVSGDLSFSHAKGRDDYLFDHSAPIQGTTVRMRHAHTSSTELKAIFDEFAAPEEYTFSRTVVPLRLAVFGNENLMSRSQAKRVLTRIERFRTVILDFSGVELIGQSFADEVFRVFATQHPGIELIPIHTNAAVGQMVTRAMAGRMAASE
jgi:hypothetical protein